MKSPVTIKQKKKMKNGTCFSIRSFGLNIRIFNNSPMNLEELSRFFGSSNLVEFTFKGVKYWYLDGNDFKYDLYRKLVLMAVKEKFYNIPAYLPSYTCNFFTKYDLQ